MNMYVMYELWSIGLCMRVKLERYLPDRFKVVIMFTAMMSIILYTEQLNVYVSKGTHSTEEDSKLIILY